MSSGCWAGMEEGGNLYQLREKAVVSCCLAAAGVLTPNKPGTGGTMGGRWEVKGSHFDSCCITAITSLFAIFAIFAYSDFSSASFPLILHPKEEVIILTMEGQR